MQDFVYRNITEVCLGRGVVASLGERVRAAGLKRVVVVSGGGAARRCGALGDAEAALDAAGISWESYTGVMPNPDLDGVLAVMETVRAMDAEGLVAVGGGSTMDTAKAAAVCLAHPGDPWEPFARRLTASVALPVFTVPTLSGTGAEMNGTAVITNTALHHKWSLRGPSPVAALIDPVYQRHVPWPIAAGCAVDAMTHVLEFSVVGTPAEVPEAALHAVSPDASAAPHTVDAPHMVDKAAATACAFLSSKSSSEAQGAGTAVLASDAAQGSGGLWPGLARGPYFREETVLALNEALLRSIVRSGEVLRIDPEHYDARASLAWAAGLGLCGFTGVGLGGGSWVSHALEHAVSGHFPQVPHGQALAVLFPCWMEEVAPEHGPMFDRLAREVWGVQGAHAGIAAMRALFTRWGLPHSLRAWGITEEAVPRLTETALAYPRKLHLAPERVERIFLRALS